MTDSTHDAGLRDRILALTGFDYLCGMRDGAFPHPALALTLGFRVAEVADGRVVVEGTPGPAHGNSTGHPHGGWYGALLDTAMACAVLTRVPRGASYTTLEYRVNILRPAPLGALVRVEGLLQHAGRSTGVARGEMRGAADGMLYATGATTCLIMSAG